MSLATLQKRLGITADGVFGPGTTKAAMTYFKLTPARAAHFFAQTSHETGGYELFSENLNYSEEGLLKTFRSDFDTNRNRVIEASERIKANKLARKPEAIANFVYANQNGNGSEESGEGWKYRGRGALQLTGKANYAQFAKYLKKPEIMTNPDLVATTYAFESAMFFFDKNKLWSICDKGVNDATILALTKRVNGGTNGLADRITKTYKYYKWTNK